MKLLDKIKNTFFEEEYIEVDEPEVKEQVVAKKIEPKEIKKEVFVENKETIDVSDDINYTDSNLVKKDSKLPYFEDEDFIEMDNKNSKISKEPKKIYGTTSDELYNSVNYNGINTTTPYSQQSKETFKPTPIISPIYGILDKNYHKDEVIDKRDKPASYVSRKNADLDSVRRKAYGEVEPLGESKISNKNNSFTQDDVVDEDNLLYDMTTDNLAPSVDKVTIADAEEYFNDLGLEYNIDYKDSRYEKATGRRVNNNLSKNDSNEEDNADLDSNLFDLIDSMYEEGDE